MLARAFARVMGEANAKTAALEREVAGTSPHRGRAGPPCARERLFSAAVESSNDAIVTKSLDGTITGWNPAAERLFGYTAAEAVGKNIDLIVPADRLAEVRDILRRIGWGEAIEHYETVRVRKDGSPVEVSLSISPIKAPSGAIIGASKIARDITESKQNPSRRCSQQIEERRRIFETSQDLILVTDSRGILVQVSPSCEAILGYAPEEMIGRNAIEFIHPDDLDNTREEMRAARRGRTHAEFRYPLHPQGRAHRDAVVDGRHGRSRCRRHFFVGRDMTESRLAQETLRESEQLARGIIDTALDAFVQMDGTTASIPDWNSQAEKIFGWSRERSARQEPRRTDHPGDRPRRSQSRRSSAFCAPGRTRSSDAASKSRRGGATARRSRSSSASPRCDAATASCSTASSATSPTRSPPRTGSGRPRRWKRSASSPAASPTTSTIS